MRPPFSGFVSWSEDPSWQLDERVISRQVEPLNVENIRKRLHEDGRPFVIRLSDGRKFPIPHQDFIALGKHAVLVIDQDGYGVSIDPLHIVSLDDTRVKKNGR